MIYFKEAMPTDTKPHKCIKCGKIIKPEEGFTHQGEVYCCSKCCKTPEDAKNVCEFC